VKACTILPAQCQLEWVLAVIMCLSVCLSVCQSVRVSQVGVLLKWLNVGLHKQHEHISFLMPKSSAKLTRGHPQRRHQMQVG